MCQAKVYLERDGDRQLLMSDVANLWVEGDTVWVSQFLEEPVAVHAVVKRADFMTHTVLLAAIDADEEGEK
jgi:predicted RNA-binding protein